MEADVSEGLSLFTWISLRLLSAVLILIAGWVIGQWVQKGIGHFRGLDATLKSFLGGLAKYAVFAIAVVTVLAQFGVQTASLIAVLGAAGLAIGLALQGTLSNVAAGVMLLILRPFNVGDYIVAGGTGGTVKALSLFGTELATPDNVFIFMPNSMVWNAEIWNYSRNSQRRQDFNIKIAMTEDIERAFQVLNDVVDAEERVMRDGAQAPQVMIGEIGPYSMDVIVRIWCSAAEYWPLKWEMTRAIKEKLDAAGIAIALPTQVEILRSEDSGGGEKKAA